MTMVIFDTKNEAEARRAYDTSRLLVREAAKHGYGEYRAHLDFMDVAAEQYSFGDHAYLRFAETIKDAIDPNGILSPGKQGIWPRRCARPAHHVSRRPNAPRDAASETPRCGASLARRGHLGPQCLVRRRLSGVHEVVLEARGSTRPGCGLRPSGRRAGRGPDGLARMPRSSAIVRFDPPRTSTSRTSSSRSVSPAGRSPRFPGSSRPGSACRTARPVMPRNGRRALRPGAAPCARPPA